MPPQTQSNERKIDSQIGGGQPVSSNFKTPCFELYPPRERQIDTEADPETERDQKIDTSSVADEDFDRVCDRCRRFDFPIDDREDVTWHDIYCKKLGLTVWRSEDMRKHDCQLSALLLQFKENSDFPLIHYSQVEPPPASSTSLPCPTKAVEAYFTADLHGNGMEFMINSLPCADEKEMPPLGTVTGLETADLCLAKAWLEHCREHHDSSCERGTISFVSGIKLIDCVTGQVCHATPGQLYVALSYVWGPQLAHDQPNSSGKTQVYPKVVKDAMLVAREVGIPYLWVDRYCIDQQNIEEKHDMVASMDKIYAGAELTLIAAAGADPRFGLPGVSTTPRIKSRSIRLSHGALDIIPDPCNEIRKTVWASRGWTFQEMLLSRRTLVFTDTQMAFRCKEQEFHEWSARSWRLHEHPSSTGPLATHLGIPVRNIGLHDERAMFPGKFDKSGSDIYNRILEYSGKVLSFPSDRLNAFEGVLNKYCHDVPGCLHHFWGIPILGFSEQPEDVHYNFRGQFTSSFLGGLAWAYQTGFEGQADRFVGSTQTNLPSWTWAAGLKMVETLRMFGLYGEEITPRKELSITFTRCTGAAGAQETLYEYVVGQQDYRNYHGWIDFTAWIASGLKAHSEEGHVRYSHPTVFYPTKKMRLDADNAATYQNVAAMSLGTTSSGELCSLLIVPNDDGTFRRIGLWVCSEVEPSEMPGESSGWELKTVRLV